MASRSRFAVSPSERRFRRLTEAQRTKESRPFHAFLVEKGFLDASLSKNNCFTYFRLFCVEKNIRVGYDHMGWSQIMFILRKLEACVRWGENNDMFTIREWPEIHSRTPKLALTQYMTSRRRENPQASVGAAPKQERIDFVLAQMRRHRSALIQNKNGVTVKSRKDRKDGKISLGKYYVGDPVVVVPVRISVSRDASRAQKLVNCDALASVREYTLTDVRSVCKGLGTVNILPGNAYEIEIRFRPLGLGNPRVTIAFEFEDGESGISYHIVRFLLASVTDADAELLKPTAPYERPPVKEKVIVTEVIDGIPPPQSSYNQLNLERSLDDYLVPPNLRCCVNKEEIEGDYKERVEAELSAASYGEKFKALLHVEELQMEVDIRHYDMENAELQFISGRYLNMKVPGLAENRPSLLKGDRLYASTAGSTIEYEGFVHEVQRDKEEVFLRFAEMFHQSFIFLKVQRFNIRFAFNRLPLQLQHRAVENLSGDDIACQQLAFPTRRSIAKKVPLYRIEKLALFDLKVGRNPEQYRAVQHILAGSSRPAPYLIFGPPGTGKTLTTVEAIKQVWKKMSGSRILACTPSNSAADDLACRLLVHIPEKEILRLNAFSRSPHSIDPLIIEKIIKISKYDAGNFWFPALEDLKKYRIIVVTLVTAGRLVSASFPPNHFTHVFIDESGHAVEPECIIPVAGLLNVNNPRGGQLVLAGDPKQLGPILRSPISIENGLQLSLLERLMERCEVYREPFDPRVATKLVLNYRSHPDILTLPNRLFYDGSLKVMADELARSSLCKWGRLPKEGFPIIFHGLEGEDEREGRSPSFFNRAEASQVAKYVEMLRDTRGIRIESGQIGVISPYRKQVQKIRTLLRGKNMDSVKVGSVEEFQGSERRIIIISTVRSSKGFLEMDEKYSLGFLKNPKRFNVAVTRAKALLIIIGNPYLLSMDEYWNEMLDYCRSKGGYTGCHYQPRSREEDVLHRLQDLHLDPDHVYTGTKDLASASTGGVSLRTEQEDPEWRDGE